MRLRSTKKLPLLFSLFLTAFLISFICFIPNGTRHTYNLSLRLMIDKWKRNTFAHDNKIAMRNCLYWLNLWSVFILACLSILSTFRAKGYYFKKTLLFSISLSLSFGVFFAALIAIDRKKFSLYARQRVFSLNDTTNFHWKVQTKPIGHWYKWIHFNSFLRLTFDLLHNFQSCDRRNKKPVLMTTAKRREYLKRVFSFSKCLEVDDRNRIWMKVFILVLFST